MIEEVMELLSKNPGISEEMKAAFLADFEKFLEVDQSRKTIEFEVSPLSRKDYEETPATPFSETGPSFEVESQKRDLMNENLGRFHKAILQKAHNRDSQKDSESEIINFIYTNSLLKPYNSQSFSIDVPLSTPLKKEDKAYYESFTVDQIDPRINKFFESIQVQSKKEDKETQCELPEENKEVFSKEEIQVLKAIQVKFAYALI